MPFPQMLNIYVNFGFFIRKKLLDLAHENLANILSKWAWKNKVRFRIQQIKMLVTCQRFGDLFLFGLVWQYSTNQNQYDKGMFKVMTTYLQQ